MRSMTGYGRGSAQADGREITVELRSVNHRYLDLSFRFPRALNFVEPLMRKMLSAGLARGHVDVSLAYQNHRQDAKRVEPDIALALSYCQAAQRIAQEANLSQALLIGDLLRLPDVMGVTEEAEDEEVLGGLIEQAAQAALADLVAAREHEGAAIQRDLKGHLHCLGVVLSDMKSLAPNQPEVYRQKLEERLSRLVFEGLDPQRLAQEVALFADKVAVDEELARLSAHIEQMDGLLFGDEPLGRKMDFLVQEMNREVNTIGSKASDLSLTRLVLESKNVLEKMREQIQNVE